MLIVFHFAKHHFVNEILNEYFTKLYGPAAGHVRSLYDRLEEAYLKGSRSGGKWLRNHNSLAAFYYYTAEDVIFVRKAWEKARKAAQGDASILRRIDYMSSRMEVSLQMMEVWDLALRLSQDKPLPAEYGSRDRALDYCVDVFSSFEDKWQKVVRTDKALGAFAVQDYRGPSFDYTINSRKEWFAATTSNILPALVKYPNAERDRKFCADPFCKVQLGLARNEYSLRNNLLDNPSFEEGDGVTPKGIDWLETGAKDWAFFSTTPYKFKYGRISKEPVFSGKFSGFIRGTGSGLLISTPAIDVSDGSRYFLVEARCWKNDPKAKVFLHVMWRNAKGDIMGPGRYSSLEIPEANIWTYRRMLVEAPEGAAHAMVDLSVENMNNSEARFDDVSFRKISVKSAWKHPGPQKSNLPVKESLIPEKNDDLQGIPASRLKQTGPRTFTFSGSGSFFATSVMPVSMQGQWIFNAELKPAGDKEATGIYIGLQFFDKEMHAIMPYNVNRVPGTVTALAAPCSFTDNVLKVTSTDGWKASNGARIAFNCKTDDSDLPNFFLCPQAGITNVTANEIHLSSEIGVEYPAGTLISEQMPGATYSYIWKVGATIPPAERRFPSRLPRLIFPKAPHSCAMLF